MGHFKNLKDEILSKFLTKKEDTDIIKAKKSIRITFIISILAIFIIAWLIFVFFTFPQEIVKVPNIENDNIYKALSKLADKKLIPQPIAKFSETYKEGVVFNQKPVAGNFIKNGREVSFNVSLGSSNNGLPDFRGFKLFDFDNYLKDKFPNNDYDFKILLPKYEFNDQFLAGEIISQEPAEGTYLKSIDNVKFVVSLGVKKGNVELLPNFVGKNINDLSNDSIKIKWTFIYKIIENNKNNLLITEQSLSEGLPINNLIKNGNTLIFTVNKYNIMGNKNKIVDFKYVDLPYNAIPYEVEFKIREKNRLTEESILKITTFGGVSIPLEYSAEMDPKFFMYINGTFSKEIDIN